LIGTGSVDGTAKLINSNTGKVVVTFECGNVNTNSNEEEDSVESVSFSNSLSLFATATVRGSIEIWDISSHVRRHKVIVDDGISKLLWDKNNQYLLYTAGLDGILRIYDGRTSELKAIKRGHNHNILDCFLSNNSSFIITASEDTTCRIYALS
jgi:WD40 repeat protein